MYIYIIFAFLSKCKKTNKNIFLIDTYFDFFVYSTKFFFNERIKVSFAIFCEKNSKDLQLKN